MDYLLLRDVWVSIKRHMFPKKRACVYCEYTDTYTAVLNGYVGLIEQSKHLSSKITSGKMTGFFNRISSNPAYHPGPDIATYLHILHKQFSTRSSDYTMNLSVCLTERLKLPLYPKIKTPEYAEKLLSEIYTIAEYLADNFGTKWVDELTYVSIMYLSVEQLETLTTVFPNTTWNNCCMYHALMTDDLDIIRYVDSKRDPNVKNSYYEVLHGRAIRDPKVAKWLFEHPTLRPPYSVFHPDSMTGDTLNVMCKFYPGKKRSIIRKTVSWLLSFSDTKLDTLKQFFEQNRILDYSVESNIDLDMYVAVNIGLCSFSVAKYVLDMFPYTGYEILVRPDNTILVKYIVRKFILTGSTDKQQITFTNRKMRLPHRKHRNPSDDRKFLRLYDWLYKHNCYEVNKLTIKECESLWCRSKILVDKSVEQLDRCIRFVNDFLNIFDVTANFNFGHKCIEYALDRGLSQNHAEWCVLLLLHFATTYMGDLRPISCAKLDIFNKKEVDNLLLIYDLNVANGIHSQAFAADIHKFVRIYRERGLSQVLHTE